MLAVSTSFFAVPTGLFLLGVLSVLGLAASRRGRRREQGARSAVPWPALLLAGILILLLAAGLLVEGRIRTILDLGLLESSTGIRVNATFHAEVLGRWTGLGREWAWFAFASSALGVGAALRASRVAGALLSSRLEVLDRYLQEFAQSVECRRPVR